VAAQTAHGGHESTLLALYTTLRHFGGIILVSPGYTDPVEFADGNPYGVSHATGADNDSPLSRTEEDALQHLVERIVAITGQLLRGRASG
jgi:NAD(P)H dehydrogenase (quinone)